MKKLLMILTLLSIFAGSGAAQSFSGRWYGLMYGCLVTVDFHDNGAMSIRSEANSNMLLTKTYTAEKKGDLYDFDLTQDVSGMSCLGIARFYGPDSLRINMKLGPQGQVNRPADIDEDSGVYGIALNLSRDRSRIHSALDNKAEIPAEAALAFERNRRLGHGLNLNGYVDGNPADGNDAPMSPEDFRSIAEAGFQSVRIDVCWIRHCSTEAPYTIDPEFFDYMDRTIRECFKNGIAVSIDQHYYPYINMSEPDAQLSWDQNIDRLKSLWKQIAEHYKDYPDDMLYFDLLNEPNMALGADGLNRLYAELIKIIRETNPGRTLLLGTPNLGQSWTLGELKLPEDDWNLIVEVHYYLPHTFTHNNLSYVESATGSSNVWEGSPEDEAPIRYDMDFCALWSSRSGRPVNVGEWGACLNADRDSRLRYFTFMHRLFDAHGFSSHIWAYRGLFGLYDMTKESWDEGVLSSLELK